MQPDFDGSTLRDVTIERLREIVEGSAEDVSGGIQSIDVTDESCDGPQRLVAHYIPIIKAMEAMFGDPAYKGRMAYKANPTFDGDGNRIFSTFDTGTQFPCSIHISSTLHALLPSP